MSPAFPARLMCQSRGSSWATSYLCTAQRYPGKGRVRLFPRLPGGEWSSAACLPRAPVCRHLARGTPTPPTAPAAWARPSRASSQGPVEIALCPFPVNREEGGREKKGQACPGRFRLECGTQAPAGGQRKGGRTACEQSTSLIILRGHVSPIVTEDELGPSKALELSSGRTVSTWWSQNSHPDRWL